MMKTAAWAGPAARPVLDVAALPAVLDVELVYVDLGNTYRMSLAEAMVVFAYSYRNGLRATIRLPQGPAIAAHDGTNIDADAPMNAVLVSLVETVGSLVDVLATSSADPQAAQREQAVNDTAQDAAAGPAA